MDQSSKVVDETMAKQKETSEIKSSSKSRRDLEAEIKKVLVPYIKDKVQIGPTKVARLIDAQYPDRKISTTEASVGRSEAYTIYRIDLIPDKEKRELNHEIYRLHCKQKMTVCASIARELGVTPDVIRQSYYWSCPRKNSLDQNKSRKRVNRNRLAIPKNREKIFEELRDIERDLKKYLGPNRWTTNFPAISNRLDRLSVLIRQFAAPVKPKTTNTTDDISADNQSETN